MAKFGPAPKFILTALLVTSMAARLVNAEKLSYYLPRTVLVVKVDVKKKTFHSAPLNELTPHFFPMATKFTLSGAASGPFYVAGVRPRQYISKDETTFLLSEPTIETTAVRDPGYRITVEPKKVLKDITLGLTFDEEGLITQANYSVKDRKWDFILRILTTSAKVAGSAFAPGMSTIASTSTPNLIGALIFESFNDPDPLNDLVKKLKVECQHFIEMTPSEQAFYLSRDLRPILRAPYCLLPIEYRSQLKEINDGTGSGIAAFLSYFESEMEAGYDPKKQAIKGNKAFREVSSERLRLFFEGWALIAELEKHQSAYLNLIGDYAGLPASADALRIAVAEREKRLAYIGEQFFGYESTESYWTGIFRIDKKSDTKIAGEVTLFCFSADPGGASPVLEPKPKNKEKPHACEANEVDVEARSSWPASAKQSNAQYELVAVNFKTYDEGGTCVPEQDALTYREPRRYELEVKLGADRKLLMKDVAMSQGGACKSYKPGGNGTLNFTLNPKTGALITGTISSNTALTSEAAGQLDTLSSAIIGARAAAIAAGKPAPEPNPLSLMETEVRKRLLQACLDNPVLPECVAYLTKK